MPRVTTPAAPAKTPSPLVQRYYGFMLGFASRLLRLGIVGPRFAAHRERLEGVMAELGLQWRPPTVHAAYRADGAIERHLALDLKLVGKTALDFFVLGHSAFQSLVDHDAEAGRAASGAVQEIVAEYGLDGALIASRLDPAWHQGVRGHRLIAELMSRAYDLVAICLLGVAKEESTCFVIMPFARRRLLRHDQFRGRDRRGHRLQDHIGRRPHHAALLRLRRWLRADCGPHRGSATAHSTARPLAAALPPGGTVFKMTAAGVTPLHSFDCSTEHCHPRGSLIQGTDGNFYGTTAGAEVGDGGSMFRITPGGAITTLRSFVCPTDGCLSISRLLRGSDGKLYGATTIDGPEGGGTLFRLSVGSAPILSVLSPAKLWVGLKNNDAVGLKVDLLAEVFVDTTKVGPGQLNKVSTGGSGFNNALLDTIPLALTGPVPVDSALKIKVSVRRTCTGTGHLSGTVRLWYNGNPVDNGANRDAGSRFGATIGDSPAARFFLRTGLALSRTAGTSKQSIDVAVDSNEPCPTRTFKPFGTWSIVP